MTETRLPSDYEIDAGKFYHWEGVGRNSRGGGVGILIHNDIPYSNIYR